MGRNYANHPESVAERRAMKSRDASDWTPRDALIEMLRRIDKGEVKADSVVIGVREKTSDGGAQTNFALAGCDSHVALGLIERVKFLMQKEDK